LKFIAKAEYFSDDLQEKWILSNLYSFFGNFILDDIKALAKDNVDADGKIDLATTKKIVSDCIHYHHKKIMALDHTKGMNASFEASQRKKHQATLDLAIEHVFQDLPLTSSLMSKLHSIGMCLQTRTFFFDGLSGLVIAGFGEDEIYPSVCTYEIEGVISKRLKYRHREDKSHKVSEGMDCAIVPFAQEDMVASFMNGMNPAVHEFISGYLHKLLKRIPDLISDNDLNGSKARKDEIREEYRKDIDSVFQTFGNDLREHMQEKHIGPVINMVQVLPKDELAAMAESLVNLTAFKRRMTDSLETVGGPIDVAVISKGDGLVWVKRKHYFPPELNQHFFSNYFRGVNNE